MTPARTVIDDSRARIVWRWLLIAFYAVAGVLHLVSPLPFLRITPWWVPTPHVVVAFTGIAELAGAAALAQPWSLRLRQAGGIGLALYAICVFPANINHMMMDMAQPGHGARLFYHAPRMVLQPLLVWLALWVGRVIDWPFLSPNPAPPTFAPPPSAPPRP